MEGLSPGHVYPNGMIDGYGQHYSVQVRINICICETGKTQ